MALRVARLPAGKLTDQVVQRLSDPIRVGEQGEVVAHHRRDGPAEYARRGSFVLVSLTQLQVSSRASTPASCGRINLLKHRQRHARAAGHETLPDRRIRNEPDQLILTPPLRPA